MLARNPYFSNDGLIDATGEIDAAFIAQAAIARARCRYANDCRDSDIAYEREKLLGFATILRNRWRAARGLPDTTVYVPCVPFGREVTGLRRSAF